MEKRGNNIPRPFSTTLHATVTNQVVHFDFLYMDLSKEGFKYIFGIEDDLSRYELIRLSLSSESSTCSSELVQMISTFSAMTI